MLSERQQLKRALEESKHLLSAPLDPPPPPPKRAPKLVARKASSSHKQASRRRRTDDDSENEYGTSSDHDDDDDEDESEEQDDDDAESLEEKPPRRRAAVAAKKKTKAAVKSKKKKDSDDDSEEDSDDDDDNSEDEAPRRKARPAPKRAKPAAGAAAPKAKTLRKDQLKSLFGESDSDEDGNDAAAPSAAASAEEPSGVEADDPGYGSDLVLDEQDRQYLNSLPEVTREQLLSERYEKRQRWKEMRTLQTTSKPAAFTAPTPSRREPKRQSQPKARQAVVESDSDDNYDGHDAALPSKPESDEASSESDKEEEEEEESDEDEVAFKKKAKRPAKRTLEDEDEEEDPEAQRDASLEDYARLHLARRRVLELVDHPNFEAGVKGMYLRVAKTVLSPHAPPDQHLSLCIDKVHWLDKPVKVKPDKQYVKCMFKCRGGPGNKTVVDVPVTNISNGPPTETEFAEAKTGLTKGRAAAQYKRFKSLLINHVLTQLEVQEMVEKSQARQTNKAIVGNPATKKATLQEELDFCLRSRTKIERDVTEGKYEEKELDAVLERLATLDERISILKKQLAKVDMIFEQTTKRMRGSGDLALVNERNIIKNNEAHAVAQEKRLTERRSAKDSDTINPFMRRPTRPIMLWATVVSGQEGEPTTTTPSASEPASPAKPKVLPAPAAKPAVSKPTQTKPVVVLASPVKQPPLPPVSVDPLPAASSKAMSFADYKSRMSQRQSEA